jgi:TonB family protein
LKDAADDCRPSQAPKMTPPKKIRLSEFEFHYPAPALKDKTGGPVEVEFTILEDGGVTDLRIVGHPRGRQLEAAAMGVVSLLLYTPTKLDECRVPTIVTYTVNYRP